MSGLFYKVIFLLCFSLSCLSSVANQASVTRLDYGYWLMHSLVQTFSDLIVENKSGGFEIELDELICYSLPIDSVELKATRTECTAFTKAGEQKTREAISLYLNLVETVIEIEKKTGKSQSIIVETTPRISLEYVSIKNLKCQSNKSLDEFLLQETHSETLCSLYSVFSSYKKP